MTADSGAYSASGDQPAAEIPTPNRPPSPCPQCGHAVLHTAQDGCTDCSCETLVDWLGPVAMAGAR